MIAETAVASHGRIEMLVNNAAVFVLKGFCATAEEWQLSPGTNVVGTAPLKEICLIRPVQAGWERNGFGTQPERWFKNNRRKKLF